MDVENITKTKHDSKVRMLSAPVWRADTRAGQEVLCVFVCFFFFAFFKTM